MSIDSPHFSYLITASSNSDSAERLFLSANDSVTNLRRSSSGNIQGDSREKLIYTKYKDGLLNENKLAFEGITSCFKCDPKDHDYVVDVQFAYLVESCQKTGYKLSNDGPVPVYRTVFLCVHCMEDVNKKRLIDPNFSLKITSNALAYFSGIK
jgi:hypothetical protein